MNKPITEKDFKEVVDANAYMDYVDEEMVVYPELIAQQSFELAKTMAIDYSNFKRDYQRIWIGADDNKIFEAYLKGEQLEAEWIKELKEKNKGQ